MKNVLLATTALVFTAGFAAAEVTTSATAKLTYGNYGTGTNPGDSRAFSQEADVDFTMSGEAGGIAYTAGLELDEGGNASAAITMSAAGFTVVYDANDISDLAATDADSQGVAQATVAGGYTADGEDNNYGDLKVSYENAGITASYAADVDGSGDYAAAAGYTTDGLSMGLATEDVAGTVTNTVSLGYTMGNIALAASGADDDTWDASLAYTMGDATVTVSTDESEVHGIAVATDLNGLSLGASYNTDEETTLSVGYTMGDVSVAVAYDSSTSDTTAYGDEAQTTLVVGYDLGGVALEFKANNQEEMEASAAFTF